MPFLNTEKKRRIVNLNYLNCTQQSHQQQQLSFICLLSQCNTPILCCHCVQSTHLSHPTIPLKTYLLSVSEQQSYLYKDQSSHSKLTFNYLYFFQQIQTFKNNMCQKLMELEQNFRNSIVEAMAKVNNVAQLYADSMRKLVKLYIGNQSFVQRLATFVKTQQKTKINTLLQQLTNNFNCPNIQQQQPQSEQIKQEKYLSLQQKLQALSRSFSSQLVQCPLPCLKPILSLTFTPPILNTPYQHYKWDPILKSPSYTINKNKITCLSSSTSKQRFAMFTLKIKQEKSKVTWAIKVTKLVGWVAIGLCLRQVVKDAAFKFNYSTIGHGSYMISGNGYVWSHTETQVNSKFQSFLFQTGDVLALQYDPLTAFLTINKVGTKPATYKLNIAPLSYGEELSPCVNMCSTGDEVQIVTVPTGVF